MNEGGALERMLKEALGSDYAKQLLDDQRDNLRLYHIYDGAGQMWATATGIDYEPTKRVTNKLKNLIKEETRFMFSRAPEIHIAPETDDAPEHEKKRCDELEARVMRVLGRSKWQNRLPKAGRDILIGKRVALKVSGSSEDDLRVQFRPSLEFFHDYAEDDTQQLNKIIYCYQKNDESEPERQRIWWQQYEMIDGRCRMTELICDGYGAVIEERCRDKDTGLTRIPSAVIINDGLTGDVLGESEVSELESLAAAYNHMTSDDTDALKFNMFPQRIFSDASEDSLKNIRISPGAMVDLQTDPAVVDKQAQYGLLESSFNYDSRVEHVLDRICDDMHELTSVPRISIEDLKSLGVSGKAMRAMYWPLICRCDERWIEWDAALRDMVDIIAEILGYKELAYQVRIEHEYPLADDTQEEQANDLREVSAQVRSRQSYIEKWDTEDGNRSAEEAIRLMAQEREILEEASYGRAEEG